jgi:hypothetical protein
MFNQLINMTKDDFKNIGLGTKIQLARGDLVEVKSIDQQNETIVFQYLNHPKTSPSRGFSLIGAPSPRSSFPLEVASAISEGAKEIGKTPTKVRCSWNELLSATVVA